MGQHYSDPKRETSPTALPDIEIGLHDARECPDCCCPCGGDCTHECAGWYWWSCLPGCLPDSDAQGPFESEEEALEDARAGMVEEEEESICATCDQIHADYPHAPGYLDSCGACQDTCHCGPGVAEGHETQCVADEHQEWEEASTSARCDQCEALMINGVYCHEQGCRNETHECKECGGLCPKRQRLCDECSADPGVEE